MIWQPEHVGLCHRIASVGRAFDALDQRVTRARRHVSERYLSDDEPLERLAGVRLEHASHQLLELSGSRVIALAHTQEFSRSPKTRILAHVACTRFAATAATTR